MTSRRARALEIAAVLAAAATLRCALFTDLGGFSDGEGPEGGGAPGDGAPAAEAGGPVTLPDGDVEMTDDDAADFGAGSHEGTTSTDGFVSLVGGTQGRFRSRVHDAGREVGFVSLSWVPAAPYGKPLPDKGGAERGYADGAIDMRDNVLLFHFDAPAGDLGGAVDEMSGGDNGGSVIGVEASTADGRVGGALRDDLGGRIGVPVSASSGLNFGVSDVTWAYWVRSTQDCPPANPPSGNRVHLGYDESAGDKTHLWLGCSSTAGSSCENPDGTGRAGGTWCSRKVPTSDCKGVCGRTPINDGKWHHVAMVKRGHSPGTLSLYVDGKLDAAEAPIAFETPIAVEPGIEFAVGGFTGGTYPAAGDFDEVAVWRRALGEADVRALYLRGALSLSLRVRVCQEADCSDDPPFVGAAPGVAFADSSQGLEPPRPVALGTLPRGRYVQYEAELASGASDATPRLHAVTVRARP